MAVLLALLAIAVRFLLVLSTETAHSNNNNGHNNSNNNNGSSQQDTTTAPLELPPVIYAQTTGPVYIPDPAKPAFVWCNATEGATISWTYRGLNISDPRVLQEVMSQEYVQFAVTSHPPANSRLVVFDHAGTVQDYVQCFVSNRRGATFGDRVLVTHAVINKTVDYRDETVLAGVVGDTLTMSCARHFIDLPDAIVRWEFQPSTPGVQGAARADLDARAGFFCNTQKSVCVIGHVDMEDAGIYRCTYHIPDRARGESARFRVLVREPPDNSLGPGTVHPLNLIDHISSPSAVETILGAEMTLICAFRGSMNGHHVTWSRAESDPNNCGGHVASPVTLATASGVLASSTSTAVPSVTSVTQTNTTDNNVVDNIDIDQNGTTLTIHNVSAEHAGFYFCVADNGFDRYSHRILVTLVTAPVLSDSVYGVEVYLGETVRLNCSVTDATRPINVTWYINTDVVTATSDEGRYRLEGDILVLHNVTVEDTSSITCNVSNRIGTTLGYRYIVVRNVSLPTTTTSTTGVVGTSASTSPEELTTSGIHTSHFPKITEGIQSTLVPSTMSSATTNILTTATAQAPVTPRHTTGNLPTTVNAATSPSMSSQTQRLSSSAPTRGTSSSHSSTQTMLTSSESNKDTHSDDVTVGGPDEAVTKVAPKDFNVIKNPTADPSYSVKDVDKRGEEISKDCGGNSSSLSGGWGLGQGGSHPWLLTLAVILVAILFGFLVGMFATRSYLRRKARYTVNNNTRDYDSHSVISNNPSIREYNRQSMRRYNKNISSRSDPPEAQSMMHGSLTMVTQETVT